MSKQDETVKVVVRIRPMSAEEERNGNLVATEAFPDRGLIVVRNPKSGDSEPPKNFTFDAVFAANVEQKNIYDICAASVVESVLNGYNGTIFAYGQVNTHTHIYINISIPTYIFIFILSFFHIQQQTGAGKTQHNTAQHSKNHRYTIE